MTIHQKRVTLTCDANGEDSDTLNALPSTLIVGKMASLYAVVVDGDAAHITVREVDAADEDDDDAVETPGRQLFYLSPEVFVPERVYFPRENLISDEDGALISSQYAPKLIETRKLQVEVNGGASGAEYTVDVYYETGGDQRF